MGCGYKDLEVWQKAMDLAVNIYQLTNSFPVEERFGLTSQMRRCAISIPSNIAEGRSRRGTKEYLHFTGVARGSLAELETQLLLAEKISYSEPKTLKTLFGKIDDIGKMLNGLMSKLESKLYHHANPKPLAPNPQPHDDYAS